MSAVGVEGRALSAAPWGGPAEEDLEGGGAAEQQHEQCFVGVHGIPSYRADIGAVSVSGENWCRVGLSIIAAAPATSVTAYPGVASQADHLFEGVEFGVEVVEHRVQVRDGAPAAGQPE